jgi:hypothetical protein
MSNSIRWAADAWESSRMKDDPHDTSEWPETGQDDGLAPVKGLVLGIAVSLVFWIVLLAAAWVLS